jgi:excisionase family DNA binding protein
MTTDVSAVAARRGRALTYKQVAEILNVSERTVAREISKGRLRADRLSIRVRRIFSDSLDEYLERTRGES